MRRRFLLPVLAATVLAALPQANAGARSIEQTASRVAEARVLAADRLAPTPRANDPITVVAVGDVADDGGAQMRTAAITETIDPAKVLALGDNAYDSGTIEEYNTLWKPSWGRFDDIVWPIPGNHEYLTPNAAGYREYFGITGRTWWARKLGAWTVIGLDSERPNNAKQLQFLRNILTINDGRPTIVQWHRPRFSSGEHGDNLSVDAMWKIVSADRDVRIVLWGHDHNYEHLAIPVEGRGTKLHAFVVGTGGVKLRGFTDPATPYTLKRINRHGVLELVLRDRSWSWAFVRTDGVRPEFGTRTF